MLKRAWLAWSSGKDSAWALHVLRTHPDVDIVGLFTTLDKDTHRVAVHAVRDSLLGEQALAVGLPLHRIQIPYPCSNDAYAAAMERLVESARANGITHLAFGDLFLEDVRAYREKLFAGSGLGLLFPLWGLHTRTLAETMVASGLRAYLTCVDPNRVPRSWAGRTFDPGFVAEMPVEIDPCGERGEFHTFAFAGPMFKHGLEVRTGDIVERGGFVYADVLPDDGRGPASVPDVPC